MNRNFILLVSLDLCKKASHAFIAVHFCFIVPMAFKLDGNSEISAQVRSNLFKANEEFGSSHKSDIFSPKNSNLFFMPCSKLPSNIP